MNIISPPYINAGNDSLLAMIPKDVERVLDVGCGGGDNGRRMRELIPDVHVVGLTHNPHEARIASAYLDAVHVIDLEHGLTKEAIMAWGKPFDLLLFSHVLEHLVDPVRVIRRCLLRLRQGGYVLVAVPNVLEWRTRMHFLRGRFIYTDHGILDRTHLRFFTFQTAPAELLNPIEGLDLVVHQGAGSVPLGPLRHGLLSRRMCTRLDQLGLRLAPNLCARETIMLARWQGCA